MAGNSPLGVDRHGAYMRGWGHGATARATDSALADHATLGIEYLRGYEDGYGARCAAGAASAERHGVDLALAIQRGGVALE